MGRKREEKKYSSKDGRGKGRRLIASKEERKKNKKMKTWREWTEGKLKTT